VDHSPVLDCTTALRCRYDHHGRVWTVCVLRRLSQHLETADEDKEKDDAPKTKKVKQTTEEWEQLNTQNAIWLRDPSDVTPEEYEKFYQAVAKVLRR